MKHEVIFAKLFVLGFVAVGMILGSVIWLTDRINQIERNQTADMVELLVLQTIDQVALSTADYSHWNLAHQIVVAKDAEAVFEHLGSGATGSELFDQIIILAPDLTVAHLFDGTENPLELAELNVSSLLPFHAELQRYAPSDYQVAQGIGQINGTYAAIAMAWLTPDENTELGGDTLPIMIGTKLLGEDALAAIEHLTQGSSYAIREAGSPDNQPFVLLPGPSGDAVAKILWTPQELGTVLRTEVMPGILLVSLGIFSICISAAFYFRKQSEMLAQANTLASTDQLTGLLNRSGLSHVLADPTTAAQIERGDVGIVYLDLNDFKKLNDEHGHKDGDRALKAMAQRLQASVRPSDQVVRLGGDEFICVVLGASPLAAATEVANRIAQACHEPIALDGHRKVIKPSIGIATSSAGVPWETLIGQADAAMYLAKRAKSGAPVQFNSQLARALTDQLDPPAQKIAS
ncbi:MAG: diguanylate cyclase [Devosiaceae bacterium]